MIKVIKVIKMIKVIKVITAMMTYRKKNTIKWKMPDLNKKLVRQIPTETFFIIKSPKH